jgi:hypothetical protein
MCVGQRETHRRPHDRGQADNSLGLGSDYRRQPHSLGDHHCHRVVAVLMRKIDYDTRHLALWLLQRGWTHKKCALHCGISESMVNKLSVSRDPNVIVDTPANLPESVEVRWTMARELAAKRLLRAGRSIKVITRYLNDELEGARVDQIDLERRFRSQGWPQFRRAA